MFDVTVLGTDFPIASDSWLATNAGLHSPVYDLNEGMKSGLSAGLTYWAGLLAPQSANPQGLAVIVSTMDAANAYATNITTDPTPSLPVASWLQKGTGYVQGTLATWKDAATIASSGGSIGDQTFTFIGLGAYLGSSVSPHVDRGWHADAETLIATGEAAADLVGTIRHEMGHALGIGTFVSSWTEDATTSFPREKYSVYELTTFDKFSGTNNFADHLYDYRGTKARDGMPIVTSAMYDHFVSDGTLTMPKSEVFLLESETSDNVAARCAYFKGEHVSEVLNGATFNGIDGVPVNGWEFIFTADDNVTDVYLPELSHLQTNGMMSHVVYSNMTTFMEVELAVMQDLGYRFDRKNYYGWSEYRDGQNYDNWQGYAKRNAAGTGWITGEANETPLAVGLDVQGRGNTIRQRADILSIGTGSAGIRVNGSENFITVASDASVHADGRRGIGVLVSDGMNHILDVAGLVTAAGEGGRALQLDYGSSACGARDDYIGSYIYYLRKVDSNGNLVDEANYQNGNFIYYDNSRNPYTPEHLIEGPLLTSVNVSGTLAGRESAVFIGKNAFVREINFLDHARVTGDITSEWKHFNETVYPNLRLNYNGKLIDPTLYVPDLVTTLNFAGDDVRLDGNVNAADNSQIVFASGTASVNGRVATTSVSVAKGAVVKGNAQYQLTQKTSLKAADGCSVEENVGRFTNAGTLAPGNSIGAITIDGDYVQNADGALEIEVSADGATDTLTVQNGTASVAGSLVLKPLSGDYYKADQTVRLANVLKTSDYSAVTPTVVTDDSASPTLTMTAVTRGEGAEASCTLSYARDYAAWAANRNEDAVARALENADAVSEPMQSLFSAIDFSSSDGSDVRQALHVLQPSVEADAARSLLASRQNFVSWRQEALQRASQAGDGRRLYAVPFGQHESRHSGNDGWRADEAGVFAGMESATGGSVIGWHGTLAKKTVKSREDRGQADAVSVALSADGLWKPQGDAWSVTAGASAAYDAVHAKRRAAFANQNYRTEDRYSVWSAGAFAGTGLDIPIASVTLTPYARLSYHVLRQGAVKESGDSSALRLDAATLQSLASSLGLRGSATTTADDGTAASFAASLAWNHEFLSRFGRYHAAFRGAENAGFTTNVEPLTRESVEAMASMKLEKDRFAFGALLGGEVFSGTGAEGFLQLQLSWKF